MSRPNSVSSYAFGSRPRRVLGVAALTVALTVPVLTAAPSSAAPALTVPAAPALTVPAAPGGGLLPADKIESVTRYTTTGVNVRSGPGTSYSVVGSYAKGTKVTGTTTSNGWLKVASGRYVSGAVLTSTPPDASSVTRYTKNTTARVRSGPSTSYAIVATYARGTEVTGTMTSNGWLRMAGGRYIAGGALVSTPPSAASVTRYTKNTSNRVRSGPSTSYAIVTTYAKGTKVTGTMTSNGWLKMDGGRYISGVLLLTSPPASETVTRYTQSNVNVRSGPSTSYTVVDRHSEGTQVTGTMTSNGWLKTGTTRFISGQVLGTEAPSDGDVTGADVLAEGRKYFGIMYAYGGNSPSAGFDCSGYTQYVFGRLGISLPRSAAAQQSAATSVSNPQPGDLVFWGYPAYHVGIYAGDGYIYDSGKPGLPVQKRKMFSGVSGYGRVL